MTQIVKQFFYRVEKTHYLQLNDLLKGIRVGTFWDLNQLLGCQLIPLKTISHTTPTLQTIIEMNILWEHFICLFHSC